MRIPRLELTTTDIKIDYKVTHPQVEIHQQKADISIEQKPAEISRESQPSQLIIDQSQAWKDTGLLPVSDMISNYAEQGRQHVLQYMAKKVQNGDQIMYNSGQGNMREVLRDIIGQDFKPKVVMSNIKFIPSYGSVKIEYIPGKLNTNVQVNKPKIDVQTHKPEIQLQRGEITGTVVQWPSIQSEVKQ